MVNSMTGFASGTGSYQGYSWTWEVRSVNAKGLDIRLRVPDWIAGLEQGIRAAIAKQISRGNVTLNLRVTREATEANVQLDESALAGVLTALGRIEKAARDKGLSLAPTTAAEILSMRGVQATNGNDDPTEGLLQALMQDLGPLLSDFLSMRATEGKALKGVLLGQVDTIETLTEGAAGVAEARADHTRKVLKDNLARVLQNAEGADESRVAQELALIAVKSDVREELDRLAAHITAARELLETKGPVGRKLDFLMQEFNREANTLCSKSQSTDLTRIGLDLKTTIDQMREQVQNVE